jgi:hypothetical protein
MRLLPLLLVALVLLVDTSRASAQEALPDVVETHDGGMLRGLIVERVPGQYVVIRTAGGDLRRIEEANVRFAGLAMASIGGGLMTAGVTFMPMIMFIRDRGRVEVRPASY